MQHKASRHQWFDNAEGGILSRGCNQSYLSGFHCRQQRVLLAFGKTMDLVEEQNGVSLVNLTELLSGINNLAYIGDRC